MSILFTVWDTYHMTVLLQNSQPLSVAFHIRDAFGATFRDNLSTVRDKVLDQAFESHLPQTLALSQTLLLTSPAHHSRYTHYSLQAWLIAPPNPPPVPHSL